MSFAGILYGQAKKPTLMILPSDNWCVQRFFITEFDNMGITVKIPDYKKAFQEDTEIGQVITKIGTLMVDRGFPLKDTEQELKNLEISSAEDAMTASSSFGSYLAESPLDKLKARARADIIIQIWWNVTKSDKGKYVSFTIEALDAYTSKRIAASTGTSAPNPDDIIPLMLEQAISSHIDPFLAQLQKHFDNMLTEGREVKITVRRWENWNYTLEDEFNGSEIIDHLNDWLADNTIEGRFTMTDATENIARFDQVRIPLFDERGRALDARQYAREFQRFLTSPPFNFNVKIMTRGLGEVVLVLGEK
ncbi:MAG TPA: DUF6175 family protein [Bacteroidales bacterium]|nr:DUF6175 family protein [Bacteroidales bacterium]HPR11957.1 DUF6175 family protein [Bacteroidales bacterium]HRW85751.1 DUF6175 family protein [Bacteroidales bacterium]